MARIEWVKQRLDNWALYKERERGGGLGFATQSMLLDVRAAGGYRESVIPVDEVDASVTDQAVESLRGGREHLHTALCCFYLRGLGIKGTARHTGRAESTVHAQLEAADVALCAWFGERAARKKSCST
jgi:hypothetical protein